MQPQPALLDQAETGTPARTPRSTLLSRNVTISGHRTSVRLEPDMWNGLIEICRRERASLHEVCTAVSSRKAANTSLTAAIRVFTMAYFRGAATEDGHARAGHGQGRAIGIAIASMPPMHEIPRTVPIPMANAARGIPANGFGNGTRHF